MSGVRPPPLRPRPGLPWPAIIIGLVVVIALLPCILFAVWRSGVSRDIAALEQKARDAGEPITLQELADMREPVPDDRNAFIALMAIWESEDPDFWRAFRENHRPMPERGGMEVDPHLPFFGRQSAKESHRLPWTADQLAAAREFVRTNTARAAAVRDALSRPYAQFPSNPAEGHKTLLPHLAQIRDEVKRLQLQALLAASDGDAESAVRSIELMLKAGESLHEERYLISQLVRVAAIGLALNAAEESITHTRSGAVQLDALERALGDLPLETAVYQALLGERAMGVSVFHTSFKDLGAAESGMDDGDDPLNPFVENMSMSSSPMNAVGFFAVDQRLMLQTFDRLLELTREGNWDDILKAEAVVRQAVTEARKFPPKIMTGLLLPALDKGVHKFVGIEARRRCALIALEVERFRRTNDGWLPESLDALPSKLAEDLLIDPYDGQRLRYRQTADGYVIYSIGADRQDQQGATVAPRGQSGAYDVAFTVERAEAK